MASWQTLAVTSKEVFFPILAFPSLRLYSTFAVLSKELRLYQLASFSWFVTFLHRHLPLFFRISVAFGVLESLVTAIEIRCHLHHKPKWITSVTEIVETATTKLCAINQVENAFGVCQCAWVERGPLKKYGENQTAMVVKIRRNPSVNNRKGNSKQHQNRLFPSACWKAIGFSGFFQ